jgi:hypothetical protein
VLAALTSAALAATFQHQLSWDISVGGSPIGHRDVTVKYVSGDTATRRIVESWTELDGAVGPLRIRYRQRMTASAEGRDPASFQSVIDENGRTREVQTRWTPAGWVVTTVADGRARTGTLDASRVDFSTADLFDPDSRLGFAGRQGARILSAESGELLQGTVADLGDSVLDVHGEQVPVHGWAWDSAEGRSAFWYSAEGYLVSYDLKLLGVAVSARLRAPPPGGVDDFPVAIGRVPVEVTPL